MDITPGPSTSKEFNKDLETLETENKPSCGIVDDSEKTIINNEIIEKCIEKEMLDFERQIFIDLTTQDALVICARGLSLHTVILNLLRVYCDPGNLVLVINADDVEEEYYINKLNSAHVYSSSSELFQNQRNEIFLNGGIHFVSTRILVVDLLKKRIPINKITGIVVLKAHTVLESCQEAFAIRLYRQDNKTGFIKAFTNSAESFTIGYGHVERIMRCLFVRELHLWPRFHSIIVQDLKKYEPVVVELHIPVSNQQQEAQLCILDLMNQIVKELKRVNKLNDFQEITVENCMTKKFHKILETQLDCIWYQLSERTKQLVAELKTLRYLMISLISNDSVTFYSLLQRYMSKEYLMKAIWVMLPNADQLFLHSKQMIYKDPEKLELNPVLCGKWEALNEILKLDIPQDIKNLKKNGHHLDEPIKILILCNDNRTCYQIKQILSYSPHMYLFYNILRNQINFKTLASEFVKDISKNNEDIKINTKTNQIEVDENLTELLKSFDVIQSTSKTSLNLTDKKRKRDNQTISDTKILSLSELSGLFKNDDENDEINNSAVSKSSYILKMSESCVHDETIHKETSTVVKSIKKKRRVSKSDDLDSSKTNTRNISFLPFSDTPDEEIDMSKVLLEDNKEPLIFIQTFKNKTNKQICLLQTLLEMQPNYIVMYHNDIAAIRQIEMYEAKIQRRKPLKVYFLIHNGTVEEQSYLTSLRKEKEAFEFLIENKAKMVVPVYQDGKQDDCVTLQKELKRTPQKNTRKAGGQQLESEEETIVPKIIVDMREFRSELPALIHRRGIEIDPVTITIGDYILTPDICVERKSLSDLIQSLNSGRLYNQCQQMTRFYNTPMLLIEFDQNKPFHLQSNYMISNDVKGTDVMQKLQLLTLHFPKLKLIWSPSPYATAQLFEELKDNKPQPDSDYAQKVGSDTDLDLINYKYNSQIYDLVIKLPGVSSRNIENFLNNGKDLKHVVSLPEEELKNLVGNEMDAKLLHRILHETHTPQRDSQMASSSSKGFPDKWKGRFGGKFKHLKK